MLRKSIPACQGGAAPFGSLASISVEEPWIAPSGGVQKVARSSGTRAAIACAAASSLGSSAEVMKIGCCRYFAARPNACFAVPYSPGEDERRHEHQHFRNMLLRKLVSRWGLTNHQ